MSITLVYATYPTEAEGKKAARALIEARLAACVAVLPGVTSVYRWEGKVEEAGEAVVFVKSDDKSRAKIIDFMAKNHPYEVPCILSLEVTGGHSPYLDWVLAEVEKT